MALCESDALIDPCLFTLPAGRSGAGLDLSPSHPSTRAVVGAHPPRSEYAVSVGKGWEGCMAFAVRPQMLTLTETLQVQRAREPAEPQPGRAMFL